MIHSSCLRHRCCRFLQFWQSGLDLPGGFAYPWHQPEQRVADGADHRHLAGGLRHVGRSIARQWRGDPPIQGDGVAGRISLCGFDDACRSVGSSAAACGVPLAVVQRVACDFLGIPGLGRSLTSDARCLAAGPPAGPYVSGGGDSAFRRLRGATGMARSNGWHDGSKRPACHELVVRKSRASPSRGLWRPAHGCGGLTGEYLSPSPE